MTEKQIEVPKVSLASNGSSASPEVGRDHPYVVRINNTIEGAVPALWKQLVKYWFCIVIFAIFSGWLFAPSVTTLIGTPYLNESNIAGSSEELDGQSQSRVVTIEHLGQLGDSFGAFNSLISSVLLIAAGMTLWLQNKQLKRFDEQQRMDDLVRQKENGRVTLFKLLELHRLAKEDFTFQDASSISKHFGAEAIDHFAMSYVSGIATEMINLKCGLHPLGQSVREKFENAIKRRNGAYIRSLFRIYTHIDSVDAWTNDEAKFYSGIIRSQMSQAELWVLVLNSRFGDGRKFIPFMEKYELLEHFYPNVANLFSRPIISGLSAEMFGENQTVRDVALAAYDSEDSAAARREILDKKIGSFTREFMSSL